MNAANSLEQLLTNVLNQDDIVRFKLPPISLIYLKIDGEIYGPFQDAKLKELIPAFESIFLHSMLRTAAKDTWMFFFEHPMFDRRKAELRFAPDFDWKNASYMYLVQGQMSAPFGLAKLKQLVASGRLKPLDHVCIDPGHKWAKVCQLPFFNRRGKKVGMYLPSIPNEEVFSEATRIAIGRIQQEEHLDATLGEILSANEKAKNNITRFTAQLLGKQKSTMILRAISALAVIVIITAFFTPSSKKARPTVQTKASAPMAQVIGKAQNERPAKKNILARPQIKTAALKTNKNKKTPSFSGSRAVASVKSSRAQRPSPSFAGKRPTSPSKDPTKAKVAPIDPPAMVYGKATRKPHLLSPAERRNLDFEGTSITPEESMAVYDQDHPEDQHRSIASEGEEGSEGEDEELGEGDEGESLQEKAFIRKMRQAFKERRQKKNGGVDGDDE